MNENPAESADSGWGRLYQVLAELAVSSPAGSRGLVVLPNCSGERTPLHDPEARGVVFGLTLGHTRADLYRDLYERNAGAMRAMGAILHGQAASSAS